MIENERNLLQIKHQTSIGIKCIIIAMVVASTQIAILNIRPNNKSSKMIINKKCLTKGKSIEKLNKNKSETNAPFKQLKLNF